VIGTVIAIGLTLFAAGVIVLAVVRVVLLGRTAVVGLLWVLAFSAFVVERYTIDLIGIGGGFEKSGILPVLVVAFGVAAIVIEYRLTGSILGVGTPDE
jgi:hypothetical protein